MLLRVLFLLSAVVISTFSFAEASLLDLSYLEEISEKTCTRKDSVLNCEGQSLKLRASNKLKKLHIKAANIEIQGLVEADQLKLDASNGIVLAPGSSLFLQESSSFNAQGTLSVHGGLFALDLALLSPSVRFSETSDVQVQNLNITSSDFRAENRLFSLTFTLSLITDLKKKFWTPHAEFNGYLEARVLTVKGPATDSKFAISKEGFVNAEQIQINTQNYLNLGKIRFSDLKINGLDHSSYGAVAGDTYEAFADKIKSEESATYNLKDAQVWGYDCVDQGQWNSQNKLGFYCQTMTAGEKSVWSADTLKLEGGNYFLSNKIYARDLDAQVQTLYTTLNSIQQTGRAKLLAKYLLLDGLWLGNSAKFEGDFIFFGPHANVKIQNLEVLIRDGKADIVRELLGRKKNSQFEDLEKIFSQLFAQEEAFNMAFTNSLSKGNFELKQRWNLHRFRTKIYDSFKESNSQWAALKLARLKVDFNVHGATGLNKDSFAVLKKFAFSNDESTDIPLIVLGAIDSHNLKMNSNGSIFLDEKSTLGSDNLMEVKSSQLVVNGKVRGKLIDLFAKSFVSSESSELSSEDILNIQAKQKMILKGLLRSTNSFLTVENGEIYFSKTSNIQTSQCISIEASQFFHDGKIDAACFHLQANNASFGANSQLSTEEVASIHSQIKTKMEGFINSEGSLHFSSDGYVEFSKDSEVHARELLSVKAKKFLQNASVSAKQIDVDVEELETFANSRMDAKEINITAIKGNLAGYFRSDRFSAKIKENLSYSGDLKSKVIEIVAKNIDLLEKSKLSAEEHLLVKADLQLKIKGLLDSESTLQVVGDSVILGDSSLIHAATLAHIKARYLEASGALDAKNLHIETVKLKDFSSSLIKGENIQLDLVEAELYGIINSKNLVINAQNRLVLRDSAQINAEESASIHGKGQVELSGEMRANVIKIFAQDFLLLQSGKLSAEEDLIIKADLKAKLDGLLESGGNLIVFAGDLKVAKTGKLSAENLQVKSESFFSEGSVEGKDVLVLDIDKSFSNSGTLKGKEVSVQSKGTFSNKGNIDAARDLYIKISSAVSAKELGHISAGSWTTVDGELHSDDVLTLLEGNSGNLNTKKLRVITTKPVVINRDVSSSFSNDIYAQSLTLEEERTYRADGDVSIHAGGVYGKAGSKLRSGGNLDIETEGDVIQESDRDSGSGRIRTSEFRAGGSARIHAKGKYQNIGSKLLAKESIVIEADGGVFIQPIYWVETREEVDEGFFVTETTIINEEKEHRANLRAHNIEIKSKANSKIENVNFNGNKKFSGVSESHHELKRDENTTKNFTGLGQVVMTAFRAATAVVASSVPGGTLVSSIAISYLESQILSRKFDMEAALKQGIISALAGGLGGMVGEYVGGAVGGSTIGLVVGGASRTATAYVAQACMHDGCKSFDVNQLGAAAFTGAVLGGLGAGSNEDFFEATGKETGAMFASHLGLQAMRGQDLNYERAGEEALHSGISYASGRATSEWMNNLQKKREEAAAKEKLEKENKAEVPELKTEAPKLSEEVQTPKAPGKKILKKKVKETVGEKVEPQERVEQAAENNQNTVKDGFCFPAGTLVKTTDGETNIEDLVQGDIVVANDFLNSKCMLAEVRTLYEREVSELVEITVNGKALLTTTNHPFFVVEENDYRRADELLVGQHLLSLEGDHVEIEDLHIRDLGKATKVYNIEVEDFHNYYVGDEQLLVHNCNGVGAGLVNGVEDFIDALSGFKEMVQHPGETLDAVANIIEHREEIATELAKKVAEAIAELPEYNSYQRGELVGRIAVELMSIAGGNLALKAGSTLAKISTNSKIAAKAAKAIRNSHTEFLETWAKNPQRGAIGEAVSELPSRHGAFRQAKRDAGIPVSQQPHDIQYVKMQGAKYEGGHALKDAEGEVIWTREYHFKNKEGKNIVIQDHSAGHLKGDQGPHFNVRTNDNTRNGKVKGIKDHYSFE